MITTTEKKAGAHAVAAQTPAQRWGLGGEEGPRCSLPLLRDIEILSRQKGFCFAANRHFSQSPLSAMFGKSERTIQRQLNRLAEAGLVTIERNGPRRKIMMTTRGIVALGRAGFIELPEESMLAEIEEEKAEQQGQEYEPLPWEIEEQSEASAEPAEEKQSAEHYHDKMTGSNEDDTPTECRPYPDTLTLLPRHFDALTPTNCRTYIQDTHTIYSDVQERANKNDEKKEETVTWNELLPEIREMLL